MTTLGIFGDSLTYRSGETADPPSREATTRALLTAAGWLNEDIFWHGVGGKRMLVADSSGKTTIQNLTDAAAALGTLDQVVIALGTNDVSMTEVEFGDAIDDILDHAATLGVGDLAWVNLAFKSAANANALTFNPVIAARVDARPWARALDWKTFIHTPTDPADWIAADSTHMSVAGYAKRDNFIIDQLQPASPATAPYFAESNGTTLTPLAVVESNGTSLTTLTVTEIGA